MALEWIVVHCWKHPMRGFCSQRKDQGGETAELWSQSVHPAGCAGHHIEEASCRGERGEPATSNIVSDETFQCSPRRILSFTNILIVHNWSWPLKCCAKECKWLSDKEANQPATLYQTRLFTFLPEEWHHLPIVIEPDRWNAVPKNENKIVLMFSWLLDTYN